HLRLHLVAERISLRAYLSDQNHGAHRAGRRDLGTDPRRRVLLGPAHGRSPTRLDPGGGDLLLLRGALCRRPDHGVGEGVTSVLSHAMSSPPVHHGSDLLRNKENPRILVIALRRLGDVLLTTPLVRSLKRGLPGARVDMLVFRGTEGMLAGN